MSRHEFSAATRRAALERAGGRCEAVGALYGLPEGERCGNSIANRRVVIDHELPDWLGGTNDLSNARAICARCDRWKTQRDRRAIDKAKRVRAKAHGQRLPKRKIRGWRDFQGRPVWRGV